MQRGKWACQTKIFTRFVHNLLVSPPAQNILLHHCCSIGKFGYPKLIVNHLIGMQNSTVGHQEEKVHSASSLQNDNIGRGMAM